MRLLDTRTGQFHCVNDPQETRYAILSHVWIPEGEQTHQDLLAIQADVRAARASGIDLPPDEVLLRASHKVRNACVYALSEGFEYVWIDSCCIDKTSSAELSEAINSMYRWYSQSTVCYVVLPDVSASDIRPSASESQFRRSRWFKRGWTLQELIAPRVVMFFSAEWDMLGGKDGLSRAIQQVTGIDEGILTHRKPLTSISVACRMSWAAGRITTREEDEAYSLLGIFGINMPTIYGEGRLAFVRLQEEILRQTPDLSIFVWGFHSTHPETYSRTEYKRRNMSLLAASPAYFSHSGGIRVLARDDFAKRLGGVDLPRPSYLITPYGVRASLPFIKQSHLAFELALLACEDEEGLLIALVLEKDRSSDTYSVGTHLIPPAAYEIAPYIQALPWMPGEKRPELHHHMRAVRVPSGPDRHRSTRARFLEVRMAEVYISYQPTALSSLPSTSFSREVPFPGHHSGRPYRVHLTPHSKLLLTQRGYTVSGPSDAREADGPSVTSHPLHTITLTKDGSGSPPDPISIHIWPCDCVLGSTTDDTWWLKAWVASSSGDVLAVDGSGNAFTGIYTSDYERSISLKHDARPRKWWELLRPRRQRPVQSTGATTEVPRPLRLARTPCGEAVAHVKSWPSSSDAYGTGRRLRFALGTHAGEPIATIELALTCDYPGDRSYPAVFSLSVDISESGVSSSVQGP